MAGSDTATREPVLEIRNLWKRFGDNVALRDVDLTITGRFLKLLGPSGPGGPEARIRDSRMPLADRGRTRCRWGATRAVVAPQGTEVAAERGGALRIEGQNVAMPAKIRDLTYQGSLTTLLTDTAIGPIRVECPTGRLDPGVSEGADVTLRWAREDVRVL